MVLTIQGVLELIDELAPFFLAEDWDNSGLQVGNPELPVNKILIALDVSKDVMDAAVDWDADLVITHHPLMIKPEKSFDFNVMPGSAIAVAAANKIGIVSAHTNLDKSENGLNDWLAEMLGFTHVKPLVPEPVIEVDQAGRHGFGRTGTIDPAVTLLEFANAVKSRMGLKGLRMVGDPNLCIQRAALCSGSGASLIPEFIDSGTQVFVTGDVKYHDARDVEQAGLGLLDIGHFASEHIVVRFLGKLVKQAAENAGHIIDIKNYTNEEDPFVAV